MHRFRSLAIGAAVTALAVTAIGAPASAASTGDVMIVNGVNGKRVDICINGKEVKSALPYARTWSKTMFASVKNIKFYAKHPGKCTGTKLGFKKLTLDDGDDFTIVVTKKTPKKVLTFDNALVATVPTPSHQGVSFYMAADTAAVNFWWEEQPYLPNQWVHSDADPSTWEKGDRWSGTFDRTDSTLVQSGRVNAVSSPKVLAGPIHRVVADGQRVQFIYLGTNRKNRTLIGVVKDVPVAGP